MKKQIKIIILIMIILLSSIFEITKVSLVFGSSYTYVIKPLLWIFIGVITFFFFKNYVIENNKYKKEVKFYVIATTLIYFLIYFFLGYVKGFAYNPYDNTFKGILLNLWTFLPIVMVKEYTRFYMINNCGKKKVLLWAFLISIIFVLTDLNVYKFDTYFATRLTTLEFILQTLAPSLIINLYLTYISYFAGYKVSIIYASVFQLVLYILPILPDINWATQSILNASIPFFSYIYINYMINKMDKTLKKKDTKVVGVKGLLAMIVVVILMLCFGLGMFPIEPLVIASNSMYPEIKKGDIVIIQDKDVNKIKKGEVIRYKMDGYYVVHRVVMIRRDSKGNLEFITKGDNNETIDLFAVKEKQVAGVVKYDIPYAGYPTLLLNKLLKTNVEDKVIVDKGRVN